MHCFGRIPKFKSWFNKEKEASSYANRKKLLKRQRKAQKKVYETLRKQQIKREKQLCTLKKAAGCPPPLACNPSPCNSSPTTSPPQIQKKYMKKPRTIQRRRVKPQSSLKKVPSRLTPPARIPSSCKSSPSNPSHYPCDRPPFFPSPNPSSKKPPCTPRIAVSCKSSSTCSCSDHEQCLARAMRKQGFCEGCWPKVACLRSSEPLKVQCECKKKKKTKKKKLRGQKIRWEPRNLCCRCIICCVLVGTIVACAGFSIPILAGLVPPP